MPLRPQQAQERHCRRQLQNEFLNGGEAGVAVVLHLLIVVNIADDAEDQGEKIDIDMGEVAVYHALPAQSHHGDADADDEHKPAHGGGALLGHVPGGADLLDALAGLELDKLGNEQLAGHSRDDKTQHAGQNHLKDHIFSSFRPDGGLFCCGITAGLARSPARPWGAFCRRSPDRFRVPCRKG